MNEKPSDNEKFLVDTNDLLFIGGRVGGGPYPLVQVLVDLIKLMEVQDGIPDTTRDD